MYFKRKLAYMAIGCLFTCIMLIRCGTDTEPNVAEVLKVRENENDRLHFFM